MSIRQLEIKIDREKPFSTCKLDRKKYADRLTKIVNLHSDGFVLAIDNKWGTGKTTFIKMWEQDLKKKKYQTVYFNAWENDFENNPLIALIGELKKFSDDSLKPKFDDVLEKASALFKNMLLITLKAFLGKHNIDSKDIKDIFNEGANGQLAVFKNDVKKYVEKKERISEFRESLSVFIEENNNKKPLIFIIDELDRCRPNYAVSILEQIKHFFSVPNIVFVLSIDKVQLGNAIRGVYGSDRIDADEYLRRFIDIEYSIPKPEVEMYVKHLYEHFNFDRFFLSKVRDESQNTQFCNHKDDFIEICRLLFTNNSIPLRQQEKMFILTELSLKSFVSGTYVVPEMLFFLIFIKIVHYDFYENLRNKKLEFPEAQEKFVEIIMANKNEETEPVYIGNAKTIFPKELLIRLEVWSVNFYYNYKNPVSDDSCDLHNKRWEEKLLIKSKIFTRDNSTEKTGESEAVTEMMKKYTFKKIMEEPNFESTMGNLDMGYFMEKIDLLENLKT